MKKTAEQIREEYIKKLTDNSIKRDEEYNKTKTADEIEARKLSINVTNICGWCTMCQRSVYYEKVSKRPHKAETLVRFTIGHVAHELPLWDNEDPALNGHEQAFTWEGIKCRMDEIDVENGIILDKKTVPSIKTKPSEYVTIQLNVYKLIAEENPDRKIKINQLFVLNMVTTNGKLQVMEVPMWSNEETKALVAKVRAELKEAVTSGVPPPAVCGSKGWVCESCQYTDLCIKDGPGSEPISRSKQAKLSSESSPGIKVKTGK